jgi:hypothetical protein
VSAACPIPRHRPDTVPWLNPDQATVAEELAEDALRDLGADWTQPADWEEIAS